MNADKEQDPQTFAIIGAAMEVHNQLGNGFLEAVYQEALMVELNSRSIEFEREKKLQIKYRDSFLNCYYKADFVCFENIIVEIKALEKISGLETSQVLNYLKATGFTRGLILNFGNERLQTKRIVLNHSD